MVTFQVSHADRGIARVAEVPVANLAGWPGHQRAMHRGFSSLTSFTQHIDVLKND
jgi:hypothetical protein